MTRERKRSIWNIADSFEGDKVVWIIVLMLILISIVCIFSSTSRLLAPGKTRVDIVQKQLLFVAFGLMTIIVCYNIKNIKIFRWCSKFGFLISLALLLFLDSHMDIGIIKAVPVHGAYRILSIFEVDVHVFEIVKIAMIPYLAWACDAYKKGELKGPEKDIWKKILYIYGPFLLVMGLIIPGSNSSALITGAIMFMVILLGGVDIKDLLLLFAAAAAVFMLCFGIYKISGGKGMKRIGTLMSRVFEEEDWEEVAKNSEKGTVMYQKAIDQLRQPYNAKIAVHQGGLIGKGPGQSTQRYVVPDISEDYMFSFIIEEYGLVGGVLIVFLYVSLMARGAIIVRNCGKDLYSKLVVAGFCLLITGQAFLHMFVNLDIGPMTGQTLPLISHGNGAFLCFCLAFGMILSISRIAVRRIEKEASGLESLAPETAPASYAGESEEMDEEDDERI